MIPNWREIELGSLRSLIRRSLKGIGSFFVLLLMLVISGPLCPSPVHAWFDETHVAVAKVAGYSKWFNACGPDMIKVKMGKREGHNHYVNNPQGSWILRILKRYRERHGPRPTSGPCCSTRRRSKWEWQKE